ncbi:MAG TPA: lasso peptide biosynthesis B2 protein [Candidatus Nanoarchaeia archaeon]|nr:lasso peptide biosynthesis B2 protein [Candidatus Nanoarchaeia archaeon]
MRALHRFVALPRARKRLLLRSLLEVLRASVQVHVLRYSRPRHLGLEDVRHRYTYLVDDVVWAVSRMAAFVPGATCLVQALAAQRLLLGSGHPARLCIGVHKSQGTPLLAHAWLELEGRIILGEYAGGQLVPLPLEDIR